MPPSQLDNLVAIGKLKVEPPAQQELDDLLHSGSVRITDAENAALGIESRFDLATTRRTRSRWQRCAGTAIAPRIATWCSSCCRPP
jgi:hypothetical protein